MPFSEPSKFTVLVTQADIDNSSQGIYNNCLVVALKRMRDNLELAGLNTAQDAATNCGTIYADTNAYTSGGEIISLCGCYVCTIIYATDTETAAKVAVQNISGVKPTAPFTATLG